jgi:hypothetical protein
MCVSKTKSYYPNEIIVGAPGEDLESSDQDEAGWMYSYEIRLRAELRREGQ